MDLLAEQLNEYSLQGIPRLPHLTFEADEDTEEALYKYVLFLAMRNRLELKSNFFFFFFPFLFLSCIQFGGRLEVDCNRLGNATWKTTSTTECHLGTSLYWSHLPSDFKSYHRCELLFYSTFQPIEIVQSKTLLCSLPSILLIKHLSSITVELSYHSFQPSFIPWSCRALKPFFKWIKSIWVNQSREVCYEDERTERNQWFR